MTWQSLLDPEVRSFILAHDKDDPAALALRGAPDAAWDFPLVLDQIKARQKAARKVPLWLEGQDGLVLPQADTVEQASSAATALYKAGLVEGRRFADLTGGAGVDSWAFAQRFEDGGVCVERDEASASLLAHNMEILTGGRVEAVCGAAEEYAQDMARADLIYIDPQRRDSARKGRYAFEECSPDITALLPVLLPKAGRVMVKASPVLDVQAGLEALGNAAAVHIVEWEGECKEVLYLLRAGADLPFDEVPVTAVRIDDEGRALHSLRFTKAQEKAAAPEYALPETYLYEPSPGFQKSGAFGLMACRYGLKKLHPHTHLYTADRMVEDFPGRAFRIAGAYPARAGAIPVKRAHLSVRNFPQKTEILRRKLDIRDGGEDYLFACTLLDGRKAVLHGVKV